VNLRVSELHSTIPTEAVSQATPQPAASGVDISSLSWDLAPAHGTHTLQTGFTPDPAVYTVDAGGPLNVRDLNTGGGCVGHTQREPDLRVHYTAGTTFPLLFYVEATADTTLLVNAPDTSWHCNDDGHHGLNPRVVFDHPQSGQYDIWVGTYGSQGAQVGLRASELTSNLGGARATPPAPSPAALAPSGPWSEFRPAGGGFTVMMPGQAAAESDHEEVCGARAPVWMGSLNVDTGIYLVGYMDAPQCLLDRGLPGVFDYFREDVSSDNSRIVSESQIRLQGHPGLELSVTVDGDASSGIMRSRVYVVRGRLYMTAGAAIGSGNDASVTRFLNSFTLLNP
jgi:hypothetical protein